MRNLFLRLLILLITAICLFYFKESMYCYWLVVISLLVGLILNYKITEEKADIISNYIFWVSFPILIYLLRGFPLINLTDSLLLVLTIKAVVLFYSFMKYKKISVTSSYLSKYWIFIVFVFLSEIILNTTYGLKSHCITIGIVSSLETIIIIFKNKEWKKSVVSIW